MTIVAVMQPYFFPYAGYFSLMRRVDTFVFFDCAQFPRRGWVHRNKVPTLRKSGEEWVTLPLAKQLRDIMIRDLAFPPDWRETLAARLARFDWLHRSESAAASALRAARQPSKVDITPCDFLVETAKVCATLLGVSCRFSFSSELDIDPNLTSQARVIAIARAVGATNYVNPSGGRKLYDRSAFHEAGLELSFMKPYRGAFTSVLHRLCFEDLDSVAREVELNSETEA